MNFTCRIPLLRAPSRGEHPYCCESKLTAQRDSQKREREWRASYSGTYLWINQKEKAIWEDMKVAYVSNECLGKANSSILLNLGRGTWLIFSRWGGEGVKRAEEQSVMALVTHPSTQRPAASESWKVIERMTMDRGGLQHSHASTLVKAPAERNDTMHISKVEFSTSWTVHLISQIVRSVRRARHGV